MCKSESIMRCFFLDFEIEAMRFIARGVRGHLPPRNFLKMVRFAVYLDPILDFKKFQKVPFFIYLKKKLPFFYIHF